ncbi:MAG: winged helix-turn-helix transcriptional regulator [Sphingosinicella sp.]|nr:winged helix-turn-helix transcriptional regulator [Sphingosinicella sp.]
MCRDQLLSSINVTPGVDMAAIKKKAKHKSAADDELDAHALAIVGFLYNRVIAGAAPALRKRTGLSVTEARIVFHLGATSWTTANKLAKNLGIDKAAISRATNRLVELGLVASERDPNHAARNILTLTDAGEAHCKLIAHFTFAREKHLLNVLDEEEHQQFLKSLRKILTNVESVNKLVAQGHFWE